MCPDCARCFAGVLGLLVETARVDAMICARHGRMERLEATAPLEPALAELQDLVPVGRPCVDEFASLGRPEQELGAKAVLRQMCSFLERKVEAFNPDLLSDVDGVEERTSTMVLEIPFRDPRCDKQKCRIRSQLRPK